MVNVAAGRGTHCVSEQSSNCRLSVPQVRCYRSVGMPQPVRSQMRQVESLYDASPGFWEASKLLVTGRSRQDEWAFFWNLCQQVQSILPNRPYVLTLLAIRQT